MTLSLLENSSAPVSCSEHPAIAREIERRTVATGRNEDYASESKLSTRDVAWHNPIHGFNVWLCPNFENMIAVSAPVFSALSIVEMKFGEVLLLLSRSREKSYCRSVRYILNPL